MKEQLRLERRQQKAARKAERKAHKGDEPDIVPASEIAPDWLDKPESESEQGLNSV